MNEILSSPQSTHIKVNNFVKCTADYSERLELSKSSKNWIIKLTNPRVIAITKWVPKTAGVSPIPGKKVSTERRTGTFPKCQVLQARGSAAGGSSREAAPAAGRLGCAPRTPRPSRAPLTCRRSACGGTWAAPPCSAGRPHCAPLGSRRSTEGHPPVPGHAAPPEPGSRRSCPVRHDSSRPQPPASCRRTAELHRDALDHQQPGPDGREHRTGPTRTAPANFNTAAASSESSCNFRFSSLAREGARTTRAGTEEKLYPCLTQALSGFWRSLSPSSLMSLIV